MPINPTQKSQEQWLVSTLEKDPIVASQGLKEVIELFRLLPTVEVTGVIGSDVPRQATICADSSIIPVLQAALGNRIVITRDQPLQLF
ncbi:hypothetical protein [Bacillus paramycoides]|uniref:hypothetical protein n=1 Tax=Bacillus paramycoides TaxID=2026194 RepID=UPI00115535A5|nr:hypothetical protein [Bacillus paramycoides]MED0962358.1 hypothetical protein [Bacillus paramycoides]